MTGTITISLDEYEKLKALEGKRLYSGNLSQEEIDMVAEIVNLKDYVILTTIDSWGNCISTRVHHSQSEYIKSFNVMIKELEREISCLKSRNLWERITRKYE